MPDEAVAESCFIHCRGAKDVNLLKREHSVVDCHPGAEPGQAGWCAKVRSSEGTEQRSMRKKELAGQRVSRTHAVVEISVELFFVIGRECGPCDPATGRLGRRNQILTVWDLQVEQFQRDRVD